METGGRLAMEQGAPVEAAATRVGAIGGPARPVRGLSPVGEVTAMLVTEQRARLTILKTGEAIDLSPGVSLWIGRHPSNRIALDDPTVSRFHACLAWRAGEALPEVVDLQSSNGVAVRGKRVDRAILRQGDLVWIGDVCLRVDAIEDGAPPAAVEPEQAAGEDFGALFAEVRPRFHYLFRTNKELANRLLEVERDRRTGSLKVLGPRRETYTLTLCSGRIIAIAAPGELGANEAAMRAAALTNGTLEFSPEFEPLDASLSLWPSDLLRRVSDGPQTQPIRRRRR